MRCALPLLIAAALLAPAYAFAQDDPGAAAWAEARSAYSAGRYADALPRAIAAAQAAPDNPQYYLGLARILFWLERYDDAVYYYDVYLNDFAGRLGSNIPAHNRVDLVRNERNAAVEERVDPAAPITMPASAAAARDALAGWLDRGTALTATGGGALSQYENMLRVGYASPDLPALRARLVRALLDEAALLVNSRTARMPSLSDEQWRTQRRRFEAARSLGGPPERSAEEAAGSIPLAALDPTIAAQLRGGPEENLDAQMALCDGQLEYLNQNWDRAATRFTTAVNADPDLLPAHLGRLNALLRGDLPIDQRHAALADLDAALARVEPASTDVLAIYRAAIALDADDAETAADLLAAALGL
jgi:tetratricopeptide (TPR) repeat protein